MDPPTLQYHSYDYIHIYGTDKMEKFAPVLLAPFYQNKTQPHVLPQHTSVHAQHRLHSQISHHYSHSCPFRFFLYCIVHWQFCS